MKIYTQCSHCESVFAVTETQMAHKSGWVRCGHCKEPFNAYAQRLSDPIEADSFIDPGAEFAQAAFEVSPDPDPGIPDDEVEPAPARPRKWTSFELTLNSDEDETWEDSDEAEEDDGDDTESPGLISAKELDLDFSVFEDGEIPARVIDTDEKPEGDDDSSLAETDADADIAPAADPGEVETTTDETEPSTVEQGGEPGGLDDAVDTELGEGTETGAEERAEQDAPEEESLVEKIVKPYPGSGPGQGVPLDSDVTAEQEVTIDPVFTIEENYYDFTRQARKANSSWLPVTFSAIVLISLAGLLGWQIFERYGAAWSQNSSLRPAIIRWCTVVNCEVPPLRDIRHVELVGTSIATHDEVAGALQVTIQLINRAEFEQAYPALEVSLTDRAGSVVGRRTLIPREFLGLEDGDRNLPSRQLISIVLDLASPPSSAVGYEVRIIDI